MHRIYKLCVINITVTCNYLSLVISFLFLTVLEYVHNFPLFFLVHIFHSQQEKTNAKEQQLNELKLKEEAAVLASLQQQQSQYSAPTPVSSNSTEIVNQHK